MAEICPRCGGLDPGCPICDAPPRREKPKAIGAVQSTLNLHYPLPEGIRISQLFGANPQWYTVTKGHNGVDWASIVGTPSYAMRRGQVSVVRNDGKVGYGRHVRIMHDDGSISIYGHLSEILVSIGDVVEAGQLIGFTGGATSDPGSGNSTGPHLHAELRYPDIPNPVPGGYVYGAINFLPLLVEATPWEVQGVDLSAWNGVMDLSITKTKAQYLHIRLGYGDGWKDSRCDNYRDQAIGNDMPYFGYWFANIGQNIDKHANGFASVAAEKPGLIGYDEDYERTYLEDKVATLNWIKGFDIKLKSLVSLKTRPYSNWNFWNSYVAPNSYFTEEQWAAHWTNAPAPMMPPGWKWQEGCEWQWEADGNGKAKEYGMVSDGDVDMDLDRCYRTVDSFNIRYGTHILPLGEVEPPSLPDFFYPNGSPGYINVRYAPNPFSETYVIGRATNLKKWHPIGIVTGSDGKQWWKINEYAYCAKWLTKF
jgi:GH25 family lysozyme M1 (1,4-beta-N-acetylmuramidase)